MDTQNILIWGAGRIGRGFLADLFQTSGYHITFVDVSEELIAQLKRAGHYTVVRAEGIGKRDDLIIHSYDAFSTAQAEEVAQALADTDLMALAVFPRDFSTVAVQMIPGLQRRHTLRPHTPLDIILCTNLAHAAFELSAILRAVLPEELRAYIEQQVGIVESLVIRMVAEPPAAERIRDPLLVWTNGYAELPVDRRAFKGAIPSVRGLRLVDDMRAEETRKLYTYNTFHAALAYWGALYGHERIVDCLADVRVRTEALGALTEASLALQAEYHFSADEMTHWNEGVVHQTNNPTLGDCVSRQGADPLRKLRRDDRLIGPILLARKHAIPTPHLIRATAAAFLYHNASDAGAIALQEHITQRGIEAAVREICQLSLTEEDIVAAVTAAYNTLKMQCQIQA
ncbi:MAG: hypothetical protein ACUVSF_11470 [Anaerolineae bacterium]